MSTDLERADDLMRSGQAEAAQALYKAAWHAQTPGSVDPVHQVWMLLSIAWSSLKCEDHEEAFEACAGALNSYADTEVVVGNPLFHLMVGLAYDGLGDSPAAVLDNLARALICGGPEIFDGEAAEHFEAVVAVLDPPEGYPSWEAARGDYEGCSRDLLNGATGYLAEVLAEKLGAPPPYQYNDDKDDGDAGDGD